MSTTAVTPPAGVRLISSCLTSLAPHGRPLLPHRAFIFVFTFIVYTAYHMSRKPISVVKGVMSENCTSPTPIEDPLVACGGWEPFYGPSSSSLLGGLDYAFLLAYAGGMFVSGHVAERVNVRHFLGSGMLLSGLFTAMFGAARYWGVHAYGYFLIVQVLAGLAQSSGWPSVVTVMGCWFPRRGSRGLLMGIWNAHTSLGNILGSVVSGALVAHDNNWGLAFIVPGAVIAGVGVLVLLFLVPHPAEIGITGTEESNTTIVKAELNGNNNGGEKKAPSSHHDVVYGGTHSSDKMTHQLEDETAVQIQPAARLHDDEHERLLPASSPGPEPVAAISIWAALRIPGVVQFSLCLFFAKLVSYTFLFWLPLYIAETTNYTSEQSADLSTAFDFGGIAGGILAGYVSDRSGGRGAALTCLVMLVLAAPALWLYQTVGAGATLPAAICLLLTCGALVNGPYALITTAVAADLGTHTSLRGSARALSTVTAIIDGTGSLGAALGPLLTGIIASSTGNWSNVFYMLIAADCTAALIVATVVFRGRKKQETSSENDEDGESCSRCVNITFPQVMTTAFFAFIVGCIVFFIVQEATGS